MNWSRNASQPRNCGGACSTGPDQPWRANPPSTSANAASCRRDNNVTPGPFETVNSKSPVLEKRTSASPISVVFGLRYISCPLLVCHPETGSENSCCEIVAQLVTQKSEINRPKINGQLSWKFCPKPKRREDACALRKSGTCRTKHQTVLHTFRTQCFW